MSGPDDEIREVMEDEKGRGKKRPKDAQLRRQERELLKFMREAMKCETEEEFLAAILESRLTDDPGRIEAALRIWRAGQRS